MYSIFNYIHINPLKHGLLTLPSLRVDKENGVYVISTAELPDLHSLLLTYEFSSYPFYTRKLGLEGITNVWLDYPVPSSWEGDDF